jgi:hypothetical protein
MDDFYTLLTDDLLTFDEVFADDTDFSITMDSYGNIDWVDNDPDQTFMAFVYYVLSVSFGTDKIAYDDEEMFKKRLAETYFQEQPLLYKKWQFLIDTLDEDTTSQLYRLSRERTMQMDTTTDGSSSLTDANTTFTKSAETPTNVITPPITSFNDTYTNQMSNVANSQTQAQTNENEANTTSNDAERDGLDKMFTIFATFPKSMIRQIGETFARHFLTIYFEDEID